MMPVNFFKKKIKKAYKKLNKLEVECSLCKGTGRDLRSYFPKLYICLRCDGEGKTDFVTNIMGDSNENYEVSSSSISSSSTSTS